MLGRVHLIWLQLKNIKILFRVLRNPDLEKDNHIANQIYLMGVTVWKAVASHILSSSPQWRGWSFIILFMLIYSIN